MRSRVFFVFFTLLACVFTSGCTSTLHIYRDAPKTSLNNDVQVVYITNPGLVRELRILRDSGIYRFSETADGARRLTLSPIRQGFRCANPLMLTIFTLGVVPGYLPGAYDFEYELETDAGTEKFEHRLPVYERFSVWERLFHQDTDMILSRALKVSERHKRPSNQVPLAVAER